MSDHWDQRTDLTRHEREQMRQLEQGKSPTAADEIYNAMLANKGNCRSCKESVVWAFTRTGKRIPIDLATERQPGAGQFDLKVLDDGRLRAVYVDAHEQALRRQRNEPGGRVSHFTSCPNADQHRKAKA